MGGSSARCLYCGHVIDTPKESVVVIEHEGERQTSLAREPELADRPHVLLVHGSCAPAGWFEEPNCQTAGEVHLWFRYGVLGLRSLGTVWDTLSSDDRRVRRNGLITQALPRADARTRTGD